MIVKNYTGAKLNFGLTAQKAKAVGIRVNVVFVGDGLSVKGNDLVGRRGLAGVVFVHKIAGALAATGASFEEITTIVQSVADNIYKVGVALDRCSAPRRGQQQGLPSESLEYRMGVQVNASAHHFILTCLQETVMNVISYLSSSNLTNGLSVAVMINNLGRLSVLELNIVAGEAADQLEKTGLDIRGMLVGTFVTSLNGPGFSVTILKIQPGFEEILNAKTTAPA